MPELDPGTIGLHALGQLGGGNRIAARSKIAATLGLLGEPFPPASRRVVDRSR